MVWGINNSKNCHKETEKKNGIKKEREKKRKGYNNSGVVECNFEFGPCFHVIKQKSAPRHLVDGKKTSG